MNKYSLSALVAAGLLAGGLTAGTAQAADLGGNCCADLEERVAELEATVARKGNRKVSLTISGWVAEQISWWDDGVEQNTYVGGIGFTLRTNFKLAGEAKISADMSAGYLLHVELNTSDPALNMNQNVDDGNNALNVLQSLWFLKSNTYGKLSVGQMSHASDNAAILVDGSGSLVPANWVHFDGLSFFLRVNGGPVTTQTWANLAYCNHIQAGFSGDCNGAPNNAVRYDSPTLGGFSLSASWGEDDFWDATARYAGEFSGIKLAGVVSWSHFSDENGLAATVRRQDSDHFQAGLYVQHVPTGLFVYGAYSKEFNDNLHPAAIAGADPLQPDGDKWYLKAGIRQKWTPLGHTVLYGEYSKNNDMFYGGLANPGAGRAVTGSELRQWGVGVVQEIDAAAMSIWLAYRNLDGSYDCNAAVAGNLCANLGGTVAGVDFDQLHVIKFGALIAF